MLLTSEEGIIELVQELKQQGRRIPPSPYTPNGLTEKQKIKAIAHHFEKILEVLGVDLNDDSMKRTPYRFAKMFIKELFVGLDEERFPKITTQENKFDYCQMLVQSNMSIQSMCEHHFVPILGVCHVAYIPNSKVIGLSKLNRIAQYYGRRPQVQERMTKQIKECLCNVLETEDVAVVVDAIHLCVRMRGVEDADARTRTSDLGGVFLQQQQRDEFFAAIPHLQALKL